MDELSYGARRHEQTCRYRSLTWSDLKGVVCINGVEVKGGRNISRSERCKEREEETKIDREKSKTEQEGKRERLRRIPGLHREPGVCVCKCFSGLWATECTWHQNAVLRRSKHVRSHFQTRWCRSSSIKPNSAEINIFSRGCGNHAVMQPWTTAEEVFSIMTKSETSQHVFHTSILHGYRSCLTNWHGLHLWCNQRQSNRPQNPPSQTL